MSIHGKVLNTNQCMCIGRLLDWYVPVDTSLYTVLKVPLVSLIYIYIYMLVQCWRLVKRCMVMYGVIVYFSLA